MTTSFKSLTNWSYSLSETFFVYKSWELKIGS